MRNEAKEGPQWRLCHELACAACWVLRCRHWVVDLDWADLSCGFGQRSEGHHETSEHCNMRRDHDCLPLGPSKARGGCGHHEERERLGCARFWGYRRTGPMLWERVEGGLGVDPGAILVEMRRRVC